MASERPLGGSPRLLLALETACGRASVALLRGDELLAQERAAEERSGAESLLPGIDAVLRRAGAALRDVEAFGVSVGPGSFTGLRVGLATVKGLAFESDLPVAPVPTLAAVARRAPRETGPVVALLDAQRGEVYAALFAGPAEGPGADPEGEGVYAPEELAARLPERCLLVGEGVALCGERVRALRGPGVLLGPPLEPSAADVGWLAQRLLARGGAVEAARLLPRYVRRAEAEVRRTGLRFE